jgi:hypothetical protein
MTFVSMYITGFSINFEKLHPSSIEGKGLIYGIYEI